MEVIVLLGAPGSGKGTAASRLKSRLVARHISTGDMLREAVREGTPAGQSAQRYMTRGELVPDHLMITLLCTVFARGSGDDRYILDGFPRTLQQAEKLDEALEGQDGSLRAVVYLDVPRDVLVARLSGRRVCPGCSAVYHVRTLRPQREGFCDRCGVALVQRKDDCPETVAKRLAVYEERTASLIAWYESGDRLMRVDGRGAADAVAEMIVEKLHA